MFPGRGVGVLSILSTVRTDAADLRPVDFRGELVPVLSHRIEHKFASLNRVTI